MDNVCNAESATIGGGRNNEALGRGSVISGGRSNDTFFEYSTVGGGFLNDAVGDYATVSGGDGNRATDWGTTIGGGRNNTAASGFATVGGGDFCEAYGYAATIPGGMENKAEGDYSFAAGRRAEAEHTGAFVWGDSDWHDKTSSRNDEFNVYASGGTRIFSNTAASTGVLLAPGGGSWTSVSDRNAKENVIPVDPQEILDRLVNVQISSWNYKAQQDEIRHMGPMAQDFYAAFGLGLGDTTIDTIDPDGVSLAAIQGLKKEKDEEIARLRAEIESLRKAVESLSTN